LKLQMNAKIFAVGMFLTNCYIVNCETTKETVIIDPGFTEQHEAKEIFTYMNENALRPKFIINTHGHPDHTCGNGRVKETFNIPILIHKNDADMLGETGKKLAGLFGIKHYSPQADTLLEDGATIDFGSQSLRVIHTPGHSTGSISLMGKHEIFTGDTLFAGSMGRVDFPGSSLEEMNASLKRLMQLPDYLTVYAGHGPATTMGTEKATNPFLLQLES
jgi:hydroxyacylglutathione hydrolase